MRHGKFFNLDLDKSSTRYGITMFDYTGLTSYDEISQQPKMLPQYPIRLVITSTSVKFILHYSTYRKNDSANPLHDFEPYGNNLKSDDKTELSITHIEETIIELPYTGKGYENLSTIVRKLYDSEFPLSSTSDSSSSFFYGNKFLLKRIRELYGENGSKVYYGNPIKRISGDDDHYHIHAYSSLDCNSLDGKWKTLNVFDSKDRCKGFLRKLLLDFMFDMEHSDVFHNSADFNVMYTGLMANFYFSALIHKYEYYFYRQLLWDELTSAKEPNGEDKDKENSLKLYRDYKSNAEKLWIQDILSSEAERIFINPEKDVRKSGRKANDKQNEWFVSPESEMRLICFPKSGKQSTSCQECNERKKHRIERKKLRGFLSIVGPEKLNRKDISQWFIGRYDFIDVFHFHQPSWLFLPAGPFFVCSALLLAIFSMVTWPCSEERCCFFRPIVELPVLLLLTALLIIFAFAMYKLICRHTLADNLHVFFPRLAAAIATGWITLASGFDLLASFFDINATGRGQNLIYVVAIVFVLTLLLVNKINQSAPRLSQLDKIKRAGMLILFGYCISMAIGIFLVDLLGERYLARGGDVETFYAEFDKECYSYEGTNSQRIFYDGNVDSLKAKREELVNALTKTYHVSNGKVWHNHPIAVKVDIPCSEHRWISFFYLRDFTVIFSFIALFVGIFIQLIIFGSDKKITEV